MRDLEKSRPLLYNPPLGCDRLAAMSRLPAVTGRRIRRHGLNVAAISYFIFNIRINQLRWKANKKHKDSVLFLRAEIQLSEQLVSVWRSELADEKMQSFKNQWTSSVNTAATFTNLEWELYMTRVNSHFGLFFWCHLIVILTVLCNTYLHTLLLCFNA